MNSCNPINTKNNKVYVYLKLLLLFELDLAKTNRYIKFFNLVGLTLTEVEFKESLDVLYRMSGDSVRTQGRVLHMRQ